jgi:serine/threonine protein kinase
MKHVSPTQICAFLVSKKWLQVRHIAECQKELEKQESVSLLQLLQKKAYLQALHLEQAEKYLQSHTFEYGHFPQGEEEKGTVVPPAMVHIFPGYELIRKLGQGGMGAVYLAKQVSLDRLVALKVLSKKLAQDQEYVGRFTAEAKVSAKFNHPNVIRGIDVAEHEGYHYFVMEYVEGRTTSQLLENGPLDEALALEIIYGIALALQYASSIQMIHRDIKPDNLMVTHEAEVKLLDLGLAKQVQENTESRLLGTPHFASPEQIRGEVLDARTDIYSLGATFFQLLTQHYPYDAQNIPLLLTRVLTEEVPDPRQYVQALSPEGVALLKKMMQKKRVHRFAHPSELVQEIERIRLLRRQNSKTSSPSHSLQRLNTQILRGSLVSKGSRRLPRPSKRSSSKAPLFLGATLLLGVLLLLFVITFQKQELPTLPTTSLPSDPDPPKKDPLFPSDSNPPQQTRSPRHFVDLFQERVQQELQSTSDPLPLGTVWGLWKEALEAQKNYPDPPHATTLKRCIQQLHHLLEEQGAQTYERFLQQEKEQVAQRKWESAQDLWRLFPLQLKETTWAQKAQEARKSFFQRYDRFSLDFQALEKALQEEDIQNAQALYQSMEKYISFTQSQSLKPLKQKLEETTRTPPPENISIEFIEDPFSRYPQEFLEEVEPLLLAPKERWKAYEEAKRFLQTAQLRYPSHSSEIAHDLWVVEILQKSWKELFDFFEKKAQEKEIVDISGERVLFLASSLEKGTLKIKIKKEENLQIESLEEETFLYRYLAVALKSDKERTLKLGLHAFFLGNYAFAAQQLSQVRGDAEPPIQKYLELARSQKSATSLQKTQALFQELETFIQNKEYDQATETLRLFQYRYQNQAFVQNPKTQKQLQKWTELCKKELFQYQKNWANYWKTQLHADLTSRNDFYKITYTFEENQELQDFYSPSPSDWEIQSLGLLGKPDALLLWNPPIHGDFQLDIHLELSTLENVALLLFSKGFHQQVRFYFALQETWAPPESQGKTTLFIHTLPSSHSTLAFTQALPFTLEKKSEPSPLYLKIQYKQEKLLLWIDSQEITKNTPLFKDHLFPSPLKGQIGFLSGKGLLLKKFTFTGIFDPLLWPPRSR